MLQRFVEDWRERRIENYRRMPADVREHAGIEESVLAGGYGYRQVLELVQNGADAILEEADCSNQSIQPGRIHVLLLNQRLYVANTGAPLDQEGIEALLSSHSSPKRGNQIGRFGIGFKSLLRLGGRLDIFSSTISLRFDPDRCRETIRRKCRLPQDERAPALRLAWPLDIRNERAGDATLDGFPWATTVVRAEIRNARMLEHIEQEIMGFPAPFLLFLPVPVTLDLVAGDDRQRQLSRGHDGQDVLLADGSSSSRWRFVSQEIRITDDAAMEDATHLHQRATVPLSWAVPLDTRREEAGRFWAFFPTETPTRVPGILNAPWKLNNDRKSIIGGEWNETLMQEAARMIAETLPSLADENDPGRILDSFPRRVDRKDEAAANLVEGIWDRLSHADVIPDAGETLRSGHCLRRPPLDDEDLLDRWSHLAGDEARARWIHPTCLKGQRKSRLDELAERLAKQPTEDATETTARLVTCTASEWFGEIAASSVDTAKCVLALIQDYSGQVKGSDWTNQRQTLKVIPTERGELRTADAVFIAPAGQEADHLETVHSDLVADPVSRRILTETLKVRALDDEAWKAELDRLLDHASAWYALDDNCWTAFWRVLRGAPEAVQAAYAKDRKEAIRVRRRDGSWRTVGSVLLPGRIVGEEDPEPVNFGVLVDMDFHLTDEHLIHLLGIADEPVGESRIERGGFASLRQRDRNCYDLLSPWLSAARSDFLREVRAQGSRFRPQEWYIQPKAQVEFVGGLVLLPELQGMARARLTRQILRAECDKSSVSFAHSTRPDVYPETWFEHPQLWLLRHHGALPIGDTPVPLGTMLARIDSDALGYLADLADLRPILMTLARAADKSPSKDRLALLWGTLCDHLLASASVRPLNLPHLWNDAAADGWTPRVLPGPNGGVPIADVYVTSSEDLARRAETRGLPVVELNDAACKLWRDNGARNLDERFEATWSETVAPVGLLRDAMPEIGPVLLESAADLTFTQTVLGLVLRIEDLEESVPCVHWQGVLYLDGDQLSGLGRSQRLQRVLREVAAAGWLARAPEDALRLIADATVEDRRAEVAAGPTLAERLLRAVGDDIESLRDALGETACRVLSADTGAMEIAELTLALLGPTVLQVLRDALDANDLNPPNRWGTAEAKAFVVEIGFPEDFAVASTSRRDAEERISGPVFLPDLHDYQEGVIDSLRDLIASGSGRRRAVVSLPTGAGKTRVTVQAAVDLVLEPKEFPRRTVLWIAQTDELCEQAVQSFRQVWINRGAAGEDLRVIRFWGGHRNPLPSGEGEPTVVVASIQTMNSRIEQDALRWLSTPGLVIVDECHHAITKSYTGVLRWLDAEAPRPGTPARDEPPFIGLSATPFRGLDDDESERLAKRFDQRMLPSAQGELHERLEAQGILARAEHVPLKSSASVSAHLLDELEAFSGSPGTIKLDQLFEAINRDLAGNEGRNSKLVEVIEASEERSVLFFANSVDHAKEMAARLCMRGIHAAAVSGDTPPSARRWFLEHFQAGELRVLCNHSVLTTGFDAPKTDMVLIARQVISPVRYMQMVGRGLRGTRNGGTERCRIVTVLDNLGRFSDRQPFHYCQRFFIPAAPPTSLARPCEASRPSGDLK